LFEFVQMQGHGHVCMQCRASASQAHSVRSCDLLSVYALKLLRGEARPDDEDTNNVLRVFEYVYPSSEFSVSKAALMCISSTLKDFMLSLSQGRSRDLGEIILPRWVAHALFPEYSANASFNFGSRRNSQFAATLGWCYSESHPDCAVTPLESVVLAALSGDADQSCSWITSKSGACCSVQRLYPLGSFKHIYTGVLINPLLKLFAGLPRSIVDFCMRRLSLKGLLPTSEHANSFPALPSESRVPYSAALSTACILLLKRCEESGCSDESAFVWELLKQGHTIESIGCNITHLMTSSLIAASDGKLWTVTPKLRRAAFEQHIASETNAIQLPPVRQCVLFKFDDTVLPSLPISTSVAAALPLSAARFEELLSEAAQSLLQQCNADLSTFAATMKDTHGSLPRSIFSIMAGDAMSRVARPCASKLHTPRSDQRKDSPCYLCLLSGDDNLVAFYNSCGHGLCRNCWEMLISSAIASSSTPMVKSGEDVSGAVTVLSLKCSADPDNKCNAKIDFGVICQAVPGLLQPFIRSTMSNLSRLLLSGGACTCQCVCGAVVSGVCEIRCSLTHVALLSSSSSDHHRL
jgi:hypothetical protein